MRRFLSLAGLAAAGAAALLYRHDRTRARQRQSAMAEAVKTSFGIVDYAVLGEGKPVLVLHGTGGGFEQALDMTEGLVAEGYRLIAPSRFGYTRSATPATPTPAVQADAFVELLDRLGLEKVDVIAISAGAWSGLHFAARYPARCGRLVLLVPATDLPCTTRTLGKALSAVFRSDVFAWALVRLANIIPRLRGWTIGVPTTVVGGANPDERVRVRKILFDSLPASDRARGMRMDVAAASPKYGIPLEQVRCPVLAISAADDRFGTAERVREIVQAVPDGKAVIYPSGGHALVNRYQDALQQIVAFLADEPRTR